MQMSVFMPCCSVLLIILEKKFYYMYVNIIHTLLPVPEIPYVVFHDLRELQWKLYKGMVKRKKSSRNFWRQASYGISTILDGTAVKTHYNLPLIFKDSVILSAYPAYPVLRLEFKRE